ncbi:hypothetical protein C8Q74DRAFT_682084 [Fomes fomentarius]|nr:hypothetical protein C8Q74DRAFT_682084 [Fomes fomentarius]
MCNTVMYNIDVACTLCAGGDAPQWPSWAEQNKCNPDPGPFQPPPSSQLDTMIPQWAYQQLSSNQDFDLPGIVEDDADTSSGGGMPRAAQIAVPIAVAVGVALLSFVVARWYLRRKSRSYRNRNVRKATLPLLPDEGGLWSYPQRWAYRLKLNLVSHPLRPLRKDSNWEIEDDDTQWLHGRDRSTTPYNDPYNPVERVQSPPMRETHVRDLGESHTSPHIQETSSSSLLPHIDFPEVRVPTIMERFARFKDGIRKSASYKSRYVSPVSPDATFRIDGSEPSPASAAPKFFNTIADFRRQPHAVAGRQEVAERATQQQQQPVRDPRPSSSNIPNDVLLISRNGENFDDSATTAVGSPRTPSSARQPPSAYSGTASHTNTSWLGGRAHSWLPSPRRANTSSTTSGAYPRELRRDPNLTSPPSWSAKFPPPPQTFQVPGPQTERTISHSPSHSHPQSQPQSAGPS